MPALYAISNCITFVN